MTDIINDTRYWSYNLRTGEVAFVTNYESSIQNIVEWDVKRFGKPRWIFFEME